MSTRETNTTTKTRYKRTIQGLMKSEEAFASPKDVGVKVNGDAFPSIDIDGNERETSVINVSTTQFMTCETNCDCLIVLQSMVMLNDAVDRKLLNMILNKAEITFTRELKDADYVPIGSTEPLGRPSYITMVEKVENTLNPAVANIVMNKIMSGDIYEKATAKVINAPVINGVAPQQPE